ncbi:hypothetical protein SprV_0301382700 [Sparganum proliferum]
MKTYYEATEEPEPEVPSKSTAVGNQSPEREMPILNSETSGESVEDMDDTNAVGGQSFLEALKEYALEVQMPLSKTRKLYNIFVRRLTFDSEDDEDENIAEQQPVRPLAGWPSPPPILHEVDSNPFRPDGELSREAELLLKHSTIQRDKVIINDPAIRPVNGLSLSPDGSVSPAGDVCGTAENHLSPTKASGVCASDNNSSQIRTGEVRSGQIPADVGDAVRSCQMLLCSLANDRLEASPDQCQTLYYEPRAPPPTSSKQSIANNNNNNNSALNPSASSVFFPSPCKGPVNLQNPEERKSPMRLHRRPVLFYTSIKLIITASPIPSARSPSSVRFMSKLFFC